MSWEWPKVTRERERDRQRERERVSLLMDHETRDEGDAAEPEKLQKVRRALAVRRIDCSEHPKP